MNKKPFGDNATGYWQRGYSVIPTEPAEKRPAKEIQSWSSYCHNLPAASRREGWLRSYSGNGIGLLLGKELEPGYRIGAVDVDDDRLVAVAEKILGNCICGKRGQNGATFFVRAKIEKGVSTTSFRKIDILIGGKMTMIPPTIHPTTQAPYEWIGAPLLGNSIPARRPDVREHVWQFLHASGLVV